MSAAEKPRLFWFDANRVCAALGVVLIHSTTNFAGQPFPGVETADRIVPVFLRSLGEFSGSEMFFFWIFMARLSALSLCPLQSGQTPFLRSQAASLFHELIIAERP